MDGRKTFRHLALLAVVGTVVGGCDDLLTVDDPDRYTDADLNKALEAVANGVEGDLATAMDGWVIYTALLSDEYIHTGTWAGYDDYDHGRIQYGNAGGSDGVMNRLLETRWAAQDAQTRFADELGSEAATSPLTVQVESIEAWADLLLAEGFCEAPAEPDGPAVSDEELYQQAVTGLTDALQTAESAGESEWATFNRAGRARAHLMLENWDQALSDAGAVPDGFVKHAHFSGNSGRQYNSVYTLTTVGQNKAAGMHDKWWSQVDTIAGYLRDPWTDQLDERAPIVHAPNELGVDGNTQHYSQLKYDERGADIPLTHSGEMRLIEAEVHWRKEQLGLAVDKINEVRAAAGLDAVAMSSDAQTVRDYLLHERFAQMFMEGQRLNDLHRFGLVEDHLGTDRPTKFPLSQREARNNQNIEDAASARCLPMS